MTENKKTVLMVSYYWPPAGGISVLRTLKIAKFLAKKGWNIVVLTVENPQYPIIDEGNFKDVPKEILILKAKAFQPFNLYKKLTGRSKNDTLANVTNANEGSMGIIHAFSVWLRANFFIPDARCLWKNNAIRVASKYLSEHKVDAIFSDGPPHTNTLIACELSKKFNIPWLMDWQDPWTQVDYYSQFPIGKRANKKHHELEQMCLKQANTMTIVSPTWKKDAETIGAKNVNVVYWGFDPDDYVGIIKIKPEKFTISHLGLLGEDRVSTALFEAIYDLVQHETGFKDNFELILAGTVSNKIDALVAKFNLEKIVTLKKQVPRKDSLELILNSDINLLLLNIAHNAKGRVPGKLFEYVYANNTILNLGPLDSDVNKIIEELELGKTFEYEAKEEIKSFILEKYRSRNNNTTSKSNKEIEKYSIQNQTLIVSEILHQITFNSTFANED